MHRVARYKAELTQAIGMACTTADLFKLVVSTLLFHLGNRIPYFNSNRRRLVRCACNGRCLALEFRQNTGDILVLYEILGASIYRAPYEVLGQVNTILDLGAHIGLATLYFATRFPKAQLVSVEPVPENFALLARNCVTNNISTRLVNKCVGSTTRLVEIHRGSSSHLHTLSQPPPKDSYGLIQVEMIEMPELLMEHAIDTVDILKVDIEGAENELFSQCDAWISRVRLIIIEVHPSKVDYQGLIDRVSACGFQYFPPGTFAPIYDTFLRDDVASEARRLGYFPG